MKIMFIVLLLILSGCRGWVSRDPPVHLNLNMDTQRKYKPYRQSLYFQDERAMRPVSKDAVARGDLDYVGSGVSGVPMQSYKTSKEMFERGRERFNIYCAPCHSILGDGNGIISYKLERMPIDFRCATKIIKNNNNFIAYLRGAMQMSRYDHIISEKDIAAIQYYITELIKFDNAKDIKCKN